MSQTLQKYLLIASLAIGFLTLYSFVEYRNYQSSIIFLQTLHAEEEPDFETIECSQRLLGTMSEEKCEVICPKDPDYGCFKVKTYDADITPNLEEDIECHTCARDQYCSDLGLLDTWDCWWNCEINPKKECVKAGGGPFGLPGPSGKTWGGEQCYSCVNKPDRCSNKWPNTSWLATCQANCQGPRKKCEFVGVYEGNSCYKCVKKPKPPKECKDMGLLKAAQCGPCNNDPWTHCVPRALTKSGEQCFECVGIRPPPKLSCDNYEGLHSSCAPCRNQGLGCRYLRNRHNGLICAECLQEPENLCAPHLYLRECPGCIISGGICVAQTRTRTGPQCYTCYKPTGDTIPYIPGRMVFTRVEITYIIIIIETPRGRIILKDKDKNLGELAGFVPSSLMALESVESSTGTATASEMSLENLAKTLKDGLLSKKNKYNESCFEDFQEKEFSQSPPPNNSNAPNKEFGSQEGRDLIPKGPIITCGKIKNEKVLAIYDTGGALVDKITKKALTENPDRILEALYRAEEANQRYSISRENQSASVQRSASEGKIVQSSEGIEPNDPLYFYEKEKKGKFLGVFGSSKKAKVTIGSTMKFGMGTVGGGGAAVTEKKGPDIKDQWGIQRVGFLPKSDPNSAWNVLDGQQKNTLVAVIDSGLDTLHPDSPQHIWRNTDEIPDNGQDDDYNGYVDDIHGWNFLDHNNDLTDLKGHGTFIAGIIAARTNNSIGIAGINPGAVIMPLKVVDEKGNTNSINIFRAILYAVNQGARVINISLGGPGISRLEQLAINYARNRGVIVVVASGNKGEYIGDVGPAAARLAVTVGSLDYDGTRSTISSYGPNNGLLAPGEEIYSLHSKDAPWMGGSADRERLYYVQSGTSFSAPMVTATASLLLAKNPQLNAQGLEDILFGTAIDLDDEGWDDQTGAGLLNASVALRQNTSDFLTVKFTEIRLNRDKKKVNSVDVFGTVRGSFKHFVVELGKGKRPGSWKQVAGPFKVQADHGWLTRIDKDFLRGSKHWVVRINVEDRAGHIKTAQSLVITK